MTAYCNRSFILTQLLFYFFSFLSLVFNTTVMSGDAALAHVSNDAESSP